LFTHHELNGLVGLRRWLAGMTGSPSLDHPLNGTDPRTTKVWQESQVCERQIGPPSRNVMERTRSELLPEHAMLRQQVIVLHCSICRPRFYHDDRLLPLILARLCSRWRDVLHVVNPETLLRWHRDLFKILWRRMFRPRGQPRQLHALVSMMAGDRIELPTRGFPEPVKSITY
jgi:hypothetical protein